MTPRLILHVGEPKCGSSALQTALSRLPDLPRADGGKLRYTVWNAAVGVSGLLTGEELRLSAMRSAYGYASWPNFRADDPDPPFLPAMEKLISKGDGRTIPIASCEGWISRHETFARHLARWGNPPVDVVAFLRPPLEWVNAAYWQWGVWHAPSLDAWIKRGNLPYSFGFDLEKWAAIPNVRLRIANSRPDVIKHFSRFYGVDLSHAEVSNASSSPALIGLLLRNRQFRPDGHNSSTEFVVQRWCPPVGGPKLWALGVRHVLALRGNSVRNRNALLNVLDVKTRVEIEADPRWMEEKPYHPAILAGPSCLDDRDELATLWTALRTGVERVSEAAGVAVPNLPELPAASASIEAWDASVLPALVALLDADRTLRQGVEGGTGLRSRALRLLPRRLRPV